MMFSIILLGALLTATPPDDGAAIFFVQNGKLGPLARNITKVTGDNITHVAILLYVDNEPYVYESTVPGGVQRRPYSEFVKHYDRLHARFPKYDSQWGVMVPSPPYTAIELQKMKSYADSQLGRTYMLRGYWRNQEVKGVHCSQYVGNIVSQSGRIESWNFKESPKSLYDKLQTVATQYSKQTKNSNN